MYTLRLFGGALVEGPTGPLAGRIAQRRQLALLAYLTLQGQRPTPRDRLLPLFWPEADAERARHCLADSVYVVRKALGEQAVLSLGDDLLLDGERVRSDVAAFEAARAAGDLRGAVDAYAGPLLDGFHLSDAPEFERWLDLERARLARAHLQALEALAERHEAAGEWTAATEWRRRAAAAEPQNSRIALRLVRALAEAGDRAGALRQAQAHAALLREEYDLEPPPELHALAAELRREPPPPAGSEDAAHPRGRPGPSPARARTGEAVGAPLPGVRRPGRRLPAALGLVLGLLALGMLVGLQALRRGPVADAGAADPGVAVALPFRVAGSDPALGYLREGMVELLAAKLTGEGGPRAADPSTVLSAWRRQVATDAQDLAQADAVRLARDLGAGRLLLGGIVGTPARLSIHATALEFLTEPNLQG